MGWKLTDEEAATLSDADRAVYGAACRYMACENAGGPMGGWRDGHDLLKSIGWAEHRREEGHRAFVSLEKPERFNPTTQPPEASGA